MKTSIKVLEQKHALETELKRRCMIFQWEEKMELATFFALNGKRLERISYTKWVEISGIYRNFQSLAQAHFTGDPKTTFGEIWRRFKESNEEEFCLARNKILFVLKY